VEVVPLDSVNGQVVSLVRLKILSRVSLGAQVNFALFRANQELVRFMLVEVETHSACQPVEEGLLFVLDKFFVLIDHQLQLDYLLCLELVLHEGPVGHSAIRRNRVEVKVLLSLLLLPADLPHRVRVLVSPYSGLVDRLVAALHPDVVYHDGSVVAADCHEGWVLRVEVEAHNA